MKVACICIPKKIMFILGNKCIDERSSKGLNILLAHKVKALWYLYLLARFIGLKVLTFTGLKVLALIFHRTQSPHLDLSQDSKSSL